MAFSVVAHIYAAFIPRDVVESGAGPWGYRAYLIYDGVIIAMSVIGLLVAWAMVSPGGLRVRPQWILVPAVCGSILLTVRGVPGLVEIILVQTGVAPRGLWALVDESRSVIEPDQMLRDALINGYFFLGAALLVPLTVRYARHVRSGG